MKSDGDPEKSGGDDFFIVESQRLDRRPSTRGETDDPNAAPIPSEMLMPELGTRVTAVFI
jgi:hypothetical protein